MAPPIQRDKGTVPLSQRPIGALGLQADHAGEEAVCGEQLFRRALLCHAAVLEHHDLVRAHDGAHAVGNHDDGLAGEQARERLLDLRLVLHVQARGGLVQEHDRRVLEQGAGDGDALALAAGEPRAVLAVIVS